MDEVIELACRFCGIPIRRGDAIDQTGTAHAACVAPDGGVSEDGERRRLLRQLWKLAKS